MDRRTAILDAAKKLVAEEGIDAISVRHVAARAGIGASTLRHYFPTQRDLYDAVIGSSFDGQVDDFRIHDARVGAGERLFECVQQFLPAPSLAAVQLQGWFGMQIGAIGPDRSEQGARLLETLTRRARERVEAWLGILDDEETLRPGTTTEHATTLLTLVDGLCLQLLTPGSIVDQEAALLTLRRVIDTAVAREQPFGKDHAPPRG